MERPTIFTNEKMDTDEKYIAVQVDHDSEQMEVDPKCYCDCHNSNVSKRWFFSWWYKMGEIFFRKWKFQ